MRVAPHGVVSLEVTELSEQELQDEVLQLRCRVQKLAALLRLVLAVLRASGFTLSHERLPDGRDKRRILCAIEQSADARAVAGPGPVPESVPCLAPAGRMCAR